MGDTPPSPRYGMKVCLPFSPSSPFPPLATALDTHFFRTSIRFANVSVQILGDIFGMYEIKSAGDLRSHFARVSPIFLYWWGRWSVWVVDFEWEGYVREEGVGHRSPLMERGRGVTPSP